MRTNEIARLVHLVLDEKFVDRAFFKYERFWPGKNEFLMLGSPGKLRYIKQCPVRFVSLEEAIETLSAYSRPTLLIHSWHSGAGELVTRVPDSVCVVWIGWGIDYYGSLIGGGKREELLMNQTRQMMREINSGRAFFLEKPSVTNLLRVSRIFSRRLGRALGRVGNWYARKSVNRNGLERVDYFIPVLKSEYDKALEENTWFRPGYVQWSSYGLPPGVYDEKIKALFYQKGANILVGNSAAPTNNHLEVFSLIERLDLRNVPYIVCPLSYGDEWYREKIIRAGERMFGDRFRPFTEFMDFESYLAMLGTIGVAFMNHRRQQALGNINLLLRLGRRVYMNADSLAFQEFKDRGYFVEEIPWDADKKDRLVLQPLPIRERERNRHIFLGRQGNAGMVGEQARAFEYAMVNCRARRHSCPNAGE